MDAAATAAVDQQTRHSPAAGSLSEPNSYAHYDSPAADHTATPTSIGDRVLNAANGAFCLTLCLPGFFQSLKMTGHLTLASLQHH